MPPSLHVANLDQLGINLDRNHATGCTRKRVRQDASARTNFKHRVVRCEFRCGDDFSNDVLIDQEMLSETLLCRGERRWHL